ncbi:MAG TPA: hypothetical protein VL614_14810 [Acetobacteraceae bacterium]|jgi:hypothetical protein|nr:hypothetical protein [Acetobacteraceae bacterium]
MKNLRRIGMLVGSVSLLGLAGCLAGCSNSSITSALSSPAGQLFCAIQTNGGGTAVVGLLDAQASAAAPTLAPVAIIATGAAKAQVDADCAAAGTGGIAVSPPANPATVPQIAIVPPKPAA